MTEENESKSSELAIRHETMQSISDNTEHQLQENKQAVNSNPQEYAKSAANRKGRVSTAVNATTLVCKSTSFQHVLPFLVY